MKKVIVSALGALLLGTACQSNRAVQDAQTTDDTLQMCVVSAERVVLELYINRKKEAKSLDGAELKEALAILKQGRYLGRDSAERNVPGFRVKLLNQEKKDICVLDWASIGSEDSGAEDGESAGRGKALQLLLPDEQLERLEKLPSVKALRELWEQEKRKEPYWDVLLSATRIDSEEADKSERPTVVYLVPHAKGAPAAERLAAFLKLYALGESVELMDEFNYTGLGYACKLGDMESVKKILAYKPNLRYGEHSDEDEEDCHCMDNMFMPSYVEIALENGHRELALYLLQQKAAPVGVRAAIKKDDVQMVQALLQAGGSVKEGEEDHNVPNILNAKSVDMVRFLYAKGSRCADGLEYLYLLRRWEVEHEAQVRRLLLQVGLVSQQDIEDFDRGGLAKLAEVGELPRPYTTKGIQQSWCFTDMHTARQLFNSLVRPDEAAQDAAAAAIMKAPISKREKAHDELWDRGKVLKASMLILGDARYAAQLKKLMPDRRGLVSKALMPHLKTVSQKKVNIWNMPDKYPQSYQLLYPEILDL